MLSPNIYNYSSLKIVRISEEELVATPLLSIYSMPVSELGTGVIAELKADKVSLFSLKRAETLRLLQELCLLPRFKYKLL